MPHVDVFAFFRGDAVNAFHHFKQAVYRAIFREIWAQLLVADAVQMLFLFFAVIGDVPRFQLGDVKFFLRERAQLRQFSLALWTRTFSEIG
ncbi:hypothetical protein D3C75_603670 [compost metagenome]